MQWCPMTPCFGILVLYVQYTVLYGPVHVNAELLFDTPPHLSRLDAQEE